MRQYWLKKGRPAAALLGSSANVFLGTAFVTIALVAHALAEDGFKAEPVRATLITDGTPLEVGKTTRLGVLLSPEPGWHVYWKATGALGLPTKITFSAPPSLKLEETEWPAPHTFTGEGAEATSGYDSPIVIAAKITPEPQYKSGSTVVVRAQASWLACSADSCVPGRALLSGAVGSTIEARPQLFTTAAEQVPLSNPKLLLLEAPMPFNLTNGNAKGMVSWRTSPKMVEWFPQPPSCVKVRAVSIETKETASTIRASIEVTPECSLPLTFPSVVAVSYQEGRKSVDLPVLLQVSP